MKSITNNVSLKLASIAIAIVLWIIAINVNNPVITTTYSIPLEFSNMDSLTNNNLVLSNERKLKDTRIDVQVQATRDDLKFISQNTDNLKANVNLKDIKLAEKTSLPVSISFSNYLINSRYQITKVYPSKIDAVFENIVLANEQVYYELEGTPAENYFISNIHITPENIKITGAESIVSTIKPISFKLDVSKAKSEVNSKFPVRIFDNNDNDITDSVTIDNKEINIVASVEEYKKIPVERPNINGTVAEGYTIRETYYEPKNVELVGKSDITAIKLPDIDINNASETKTFTFSLKDIANTKDIRLKDSEHNNIVVTVVVEKVNGQIKKQAHM